LYIRVFFNLPEISVGNVLGSKPPEYLNVVVNEIVLSELLTKIVVSEVCHSSKSLSSITIRIGLKFNPFRNKKLLDENTDPEASFPN
jgi:hypothetical protein